MNDTLFGNRLRPLKICLLFFVMALALAIQFRGQIGNGFSVLYGDRYDAAIVTTILEHWRNVLHGASYWSQANYFYPYSKTLGHTDGYFLLGLVYSAVRAFGADPFLSSELSNMAVKGLGFLALFVTCRRMFKVSYGWSLLAATLFLLANNATIHGQRIQLTTITFAPIMALLMWTAWRALAAGHRRRFLAYGSAAGVFLGAWSITCFYTTWFFILFAGATVLALVILAGRDGRRALMAQLAAQRFAVFGVVVVAGLSLYPLLSVYLAKSQETGMRPFETVLSNTVPLAGVLQIGTENLLFGRIYNHFLSVVAPGYVPNGEYYNTGIAPILFFLFVAGCVLVLRRRGVTTAATGQPRAGLLLRAICIATIGTWLLTLNVGGVSAWYLVYHLVPGAKALSVVSAYQIFLTIPVLVIAAHYLSVRGPGAPAGLTVLLAGLLVLEELNGGYISLVRAEERARVAVPADPPPQCKAFFASGWSNQATVTPMSEWINNHYAHNVSAMLIAEIKHLPTINGVASFNPPDWNFETPNAPDYQDRVRAYAVKHKVDGLCRLDLEAKRWDVQW